MSDTRKEREVYSSDLSPKECGKLKPCIPQPKSGGRPPEYDRLEIVNAIRYPLRTGCSWRLLPHDFPPWGRVAITSAHGVVMEHGSAFMERFA